MIKKTTSLIFLISFFQLLNIFSQENSLVEDSYLQYFNLPRESIFVHTNKTTFLTNEEVWFRVYTYDRKNNQTSKKTTNIYVGLYNNKGEQIEKKLFLGINGMASGNLFINKDLASGEYYLKASTNWMKNFKEDDSFVQKINVVNSESQSELKKSVSSKEYDFQILPEGGNILYGVKNTVGFKTLNDKAKGILTSGDVINSNNEIITSFKSNTLGVGKFSFTPLKNEKYSINIKLSNGKTSIEKLPNIKTVGIALSLSNINKDNVILDFKTNNRSFEILKDKNYKILISKDGKVKSLPLVLNAKNKKILLPKKDLFFGVNTLTVFNEEDKPVLERLFFIDQNKINKVAIKLDLKEKVEDSLVYYVNNKLLNSEQNLLNTSISILPAETKSYNPNYNIISAFYLKPYIKGNIEKPGYYFKNFNRKKAYELDILLLTQGWSRYSWDDIFKSPPIPNFDFENGVAANGHINTNLGKIKSIFLHPTKYNSSVFIDFDNKGKFNLKNFYPETNEKIYFSYIDKKGKMKKPGIYISYIRFSSKDKVNTNTYNDYSSFLSKNKKVLDNFILDDSFEELDEVYIKSDLKKKLRKELRDPILVNGKVKKITADDINTYPNITDYIQNNGFNVNTSVSLGQVIITSRGRGGEASPTVFLDNIILRDFSVLTNLSTQDVDKVVIDQTGIGLGLSGGFGGAIKIFRKKGARITSGGRNINTTSFESIVDYGFEPVKEFYRPKYITEETRTFRDYGVVYWNPNLEIYANNQSTIKFINNGAESYRVFIEGITSDGELFSSEHVLSIK